MARGDEIDRIVARNTGLTSANISNTQRHNEREKDVYANVDIVPERTNMNIHFKSPTGNYAEMFNQMEEEKLISTRGLKSDAKKFAEMIIDVNSAYFYNHGGYEYAKRFYEDAYKCCAKIIGGEEYILSAVMHADERNSAMSKELNEDIYHYHLHVVYVPVVEKEIKFSKRCKDKSLIGKVKEKITQVSFSKKWESFPLTDENGNEKKSKTGKTIYRKSYSVLQDNVYELMREKGYTDFERGEKFSTEENLSVIQFKVNQEEKKLKEISSLVQKQNELKSSLEEKAENVLRKSRVMVENAKNNFPAVQEVLPKPKINESAKNYRLRIIPIIEKYFKKAAYMVTAYIEMKHKYEQFQNRMNYLESRNDSLEKLNNTLTVAKNKANDKASKFDRLVSHFGLERVNSWLNETISERQMSKQHHHDYER